MARFGLRLRLELGQTQKFYYKIVSGQYELFSKKEKKPKVSTKESSKRKGVWLGENKKEFVRETRVEHICARCEQPIQKGSSAEKLIPLEKGKLAVEKTDYFHLEKKCPEIINRKTN